MPEEYVWKLESERLLAKVKELQAALAKCERERDEALARVGQLERLVEALETIQQKAVLG